MTTNAPPTTMTIIHHHVATNWASGCTRTSGCRLHVLCTQRVVLPGKARVCTRIVPGAAEVSLHQDVQCDWYAPALSLVLRVGSQT